MSLRDGSKKMSKSDASDLSRINLTDDADTISKKIRKAKTDPAALPSEARRAEGQARGRKPGRALCGPGRDQQGGSAGRVRRPAVFRCSSRRWPTWRSRSSRRSPARCAASPPIRPMSTACCATAAERAAVLAESDDERRARDRRPARQLNRTAAPACRTGDSGWQIAPFCLRREADHGLQTPQPRSRPPPQIPGDHRRHARNASAPSPMPRGGRRAPAACWCCSM